jgi:hypothetical protein
MSGRTRLKSKGRRGGEAERFAYIPESLLQSPAGQSLPHAALKVLTILLVGRTRERNGTMCCSESYAAQYGVTAKATVLRSLVELQKRSIIVVTRRVQKFKKHPTLYAVTWWPIMNRDGQPLTTPEPATYAYLNWRHITSTMSVDETEPAVISSHSPRGDLTLPTRVDGVDHHTHGESKGQYFHTHGEGQSLDLGGGQRPAPSAPAVRRSRA